MIEGGAPSFEAFVGAELPRLLGLARALTANHHDAWDLVQDCLIKVGLRWRRIDAGGNPGAYARVVLVRLNIDRLRERRREWPTRDLPDTGYVDDPRLGVAPWLLEAMAALTPRQRTAVVLRFTDDLDMAEIARVMDCAVGTAKSHLSRGLDRLRALAPDPSAAREDEIRGQR